MSERPSCFDAACAACWAIEVANDVPRLPAQGLVSTVIVGLSGAFSPVVSSAATEAEKFCGTSRTPYSLPEARPSLASAASSTRQETWSLGSGEVLMPAVIRAPRFTRCPITVAPRSALTSPMGMRCRSLRGLRMPPK